MRGAPPPFTRMSSRPEQGVSSPNGKSRRKCEIEHASCTAFRRDSLS